jgi:hypothetical protein
MEKPQYKDIVYTMAQHEALLKEFDDLRQKVNSKSYIAFFNYNESHRQCWFYSDEETVAYFKDLMAESNYHQYEFNRFKLMLQESLIEKQTLMNMIVALRDKIKDLSEIKKPKRFLGFLWKIKGNK